MTPLLRLAIAIGCLGLLWVGGSAGPSDDYVPPGGDGPVFKERFVNAKLDYHRSDPGITWYFQKSTFVLLCKNSTFPEDLCRPLLGKFQEAKRIEGSWDWDAQKAELILTDLKVDGSPVSHKPRLKVEPRGRIRVDILGRQYNVHPGEGKMRP